jgi:hypothetical protein
MSSPPSNNLEFENNIKEVELSLQRLKKRYQLILHEQQKKAKSLQKLATIEIDPSMQNEVHSLRDELIDIEINLESGLLKDEQLKRLFWQTIKTGLMGDVFWQSIRFGGIGLILGWFLRAYSQK